MAHFFDAKFPKNIVADQWIFAPVYFSSTDSEIQGEAATQVVLDMAKDGSSLRIIVEAVPAAVYM